MHTPAIAIYFQYIYNLNFIAMPAKINWPEAIKPLLKKYKNTKHPLDYGNIYQLLVMVVLSAQGSDKQVNKIAPAFFENFPNCRWCAQFWQQKQMADRTRKAD